MATRKRTASKASRELSSKTSTKDQKSVAAAALRAVEDGKKSNTKKTSTKKRKK